MNLVVIFQKKKLCGNNFMREEGEHVVDVVLYGIDIRVRTLWRARQVGSGDPEIRLNSVVKPIFESCNNTYDVRE